MSGQFQKLSAEVKILDLQERMVQEISPTSARLDTEVSQSQFSRKWTKETWDYQPSIFWRCNGWGKSLVVNQLDDFL